MPLTSNKSLLITAVMLVLLGLSTLYLSQAISDPESEITLLSIEAQNDTAQRAIEEYSQSPSPENEIALESALIKRKEILSELAENDAQLFLESVLDEETRQKVPQDLVTQGLIEKEVRQKGQYVATIIDDFKNEQSEQQDIFIPDQAADQPIFQLNEDQFVEQEIESGSTVEIAAYSLENQLVINTNQENSIQVSSVPEIQTTGEIKYAVILVDTDNNDFVTMPTQSEFQNFFLNDSDSIQAYYQKNSFNNLAISADFYGYYQVNGNQYSNAKNCDNWSITYQADTLAQADGVPLDSYTHILYLFPSTGCSYGGQGTLSGIPARSWILYNDSNNIKTNTRLFATFVTVHEIGHNLGMYHANRLNCNQLIAFHYFDPYQCFSYEYGDTHDAMGSGVVSFFNPSYLEKAQWLSDSNLVEVNQSSTYTLSALHQDTTDLKVLKIPLKNRLDSLYLSYRPNDNFFDSQNQSSPAKGVSFHLFDSTRFNDNSDAALVKFDSQYGYYQPFEYKFLYEGETFQDDDNQLEITVTDLEDDFATVSVVLNDDGSNCVRNDPSFTVRSASVNFYQAFGYFSNIVDITNNDVDCPPRDFSLSMSNPDPDNLTIETDYSTFRVIAGGKTAHFIDMVGSANYTRDGDVVEVTLESEGATFTRPFTIKNLTLLESYIDGVTPFNSLYGWVFKKYNPNETLTIDFYTDQERSAQALVGTTTTNVLRNDVNATFNITGNHGFSLRIPQKFYDNQPHTFYGYVRQTGTYIGSVTTTLPGNKVLGSLSSQLTGFGQLYGWAFLPEDTAQPMQIEIYEGSKLVTTTQTSTLRQDVNTAYTISGNHGFRATIPPQYFDNQRHTFTAAAINPDGSRQPLLNSIELITQRRYIGNAIIYPSVGRINGWVFDNGDYSVQPQVFVDVNSESGYEEGFFLRADKPRSAVNDVFNVTGDHGFYYKIPNKFKDGRTYTFKFFVFPAGTNSNLTLDLGTFTYKYEIPASATPAPIATPTPQ